MVCHHCFLVCFSFRSIVVVDGYHRLVQISNRVFAFVAILVFLY